MSDCDHFEGRTRRGKKLTHTEHAEQQIQLGLQLQPQELVSWIDTSSGSLAEEAMVFLLMHHRSAGGSLIEEILAAAVDQRMRARAAECYGNFMGAFSSKELCKEVASLAWIILLESPAGRGVWLQLCFRRFIHNLARDVLRGIRPANMTLADLDSVAGLEMMDHRASPEDLVYAREMLAQLKPHQRQAFIMQHGFREPQGAIAKALGRSDRSVRTWFVTLP
jgi:hypothetical protein